MIRLLCSDFLSDISFYLGRDCNELLSGGLVQQARQTGASSRAPTTKLFFEYSFLKKPKWSADSFYDQERNGGDRCVITEGFTGSD